jgi:general secretion pathway protein A
MSEDAAVRLLLRRWDLDVQDLGGGEPCVRVAAFGLRCERERGKLSNVRYFDRPVLLRLADEDGAPRYAVLGALDATHGTLDLESGASELVPVPAIEVLWDGDYTLLWQPPPTGAPMIGPGASADSVRWLRRQIAALPGSGLTDTASDVFDIRLTNQVKTFQSAQGLAADGIAGPRTLIALHNAIATDGIPRLMPASVGTGANGVDAALTRHAGNANGVVEP